MLVSAEPPPESNRWMSGWNRRAVSHCKFEEGGIHRFPIRHTQFIEEPGLGTLPHMVSIKLPEAHTTTHETKPGTRTTPRTQQLAICVTLSSESKSNRIGPTYMPFRRLKPNLLTGDPLLKENQGESGVRFPMYRSPENIDNGIFLKNVPQCILH